MQSSDIYQSSRLAAGFGRHLCSVMCYGGVLMVIWLVTLLLRPAI